jgi:hypothetical protein
MLSRTPSQTAVGSGRHCPRLANLHGSGTKLFLEQSWHRDIRIELPHMQSVTPGFHLDRAQIVGVGTFESWQHVQREINDRAVVQGDDHPVDAAIVARADCERRYSCCAGVWSSAVDTSPLLVAPHG